MKKLTKREKLLIYILGCFLIGFFGIYFVILPSYSSFQAVNDQAAEAQFTKESMEMAIDAIPSTMQARDDATANLAMLKTPFQPKLTNEGLDMLLTQLSLDYSLSPKVLAIESNELAGVETFTAYTSDEQASAEVGTESTTTDSISTEDITATAKEVVNISDETTETTTTAENMELEASGDGAAAWTGVVNMELTGTQINFYRLLDAVAARPDMIIRDFTIAPEATATTTGTTATTSAVPKLSGGNITISVTFVVYMMEE
jgi:hypothetical protein